MDLYNQFKKELINLNETITGNKYLLAISGGVDSMVLLDLFEQLQREFMFEFEVVTINHQLREQSQSEVDYLQELCEQKNIKLHIYNWKTEDKKQSGSNENAARNFRYQKFLETLQDREINNLVLAHHSDDQAETILMKLIRSGNIAEVQGMLPIRNLKQNNLLRPLLKFSKQELINYAKNQKLTYFEDETNSENFTVRNRLRNQVLPVLKKENSKLLEHFNEFANQLQTSNLVVEKYFQPIFLNDLTKDLHSGTLKNLKTLSYQENILFWNLYKKKKQLFSLNDRQIEQISDCVKSSKPNLEVDLDDNLVFVKDHDQFYLEEKQTFPPINTALKMNKRAKLNNNVQTAMLTDEFKVSNSIKITVDQVPKKIVLRTRQPGDVLTLNDNKHQKLKKRMIDLKLSKKQKEKALILTFDDKIVWVDGIYNISNYEKGNKQNFYLQIKGDLNETK
ncbi:tRNA lysidine(34) synthetase TilS [Lactobacillus sp. YT155]|uniref:tRNA lysidine(34) synthetase TilS n=1 Tax=Lactobacillus sp. YT155 TaxID=3060955 RepID=UPI00265DA7EE|nr:tRNA lysidine(34) synthetase TilS [Lactobacillus sp. YT155]MDO1604585.1 tRNA lysidine(34) synthetase TilS [Lactobacillus sp. YT155]